MNLNISKLETKELFELIIKVQILFNNHQEEIPITARELAIWSTLGDVVIIKNEGFNKYKSDFTPEPFYTHKISLNLDLGTAAEELLFRVFNEFLPFYYLDHSHEYKAITRNKYDEEITVPLFDQPFNANEQPSKTKEVL